MKTLYANGDSFVLGMEILEHSPRGEENKQYSFPKHLSNHLGCDEYINNAHNGATNEFIFRKTLFDLQNLEKQGYKSEDVFVLIGITSLFRIEVDGDGFFDQIYNIKKILEDAKNRGFMVYPDEYDRYGNLFVQPSLDLGIYDEKKKKNINIGEEIITWCTRYLWTDKLQLESQEARILALHEILKFKGYKHLFVNTVYPLENTKYLDLSCKNYYNLDTDAFWLFGCTNFEYSRRPANHFAEPPHAEYGRLLYEYVRKNIL